MFYEVIPAGKVEELTYQSAEVLQRGQVVMVPLGRRKVAGVVVKKVVQPEFACRAVERVLYSTPLPEQLMVAVEFLHRYYLAAKGEGVQMVLPAGVEKKRRAKVSGGAKSDFSRHASSRPSLRGSSLGSLPLSRMASKMSDFRASRPPRECCLKFPDEQKIQLNPQQQNALRGLQEATGATKLLWGVTGSGKTNIYLKMAENALKTQKSVILLVPEIALTGQLVRVFEQVFGERVMLIHSRQTEAERHRIFEELLATEMPLVVVGPRSALFAPLHNLGLVIIDEEHENTYYQENAPRYSAVRMASQMVRAVGGSCILGSATPAVVDYYLARERGGLVRLSEKAKATAVKPEVTVVDLTKRENFRKNRYFSDTLLAKMEANLAAGRQTLIFHNRRGSAPLTICENCGEEMLCPNCYLPLTLHADGYVLRCHTCEYSCPVPAGCPKCGAAGLIHKGFGTKLLETEAKRLFPAARVRRFDADNKRGEGLEAVYNEVHNGEVDILIGTQTVAKGLDLPLLSTVGVVAADAGLNLPDFAAEERVFQLLTQVIGRVGRGHLNTAEVVVQTYRPEHPVIKLAVAEDYEGFAEYLLGQRRAGGFPPYLYVARAEVTYKTEAVVLRKVREARKALEEMGGGGVDRTGDVDRTGGDGTGGANGAGVGIAGGKGLLVSPPQPAFHERTAKGHTWQMVVRSTSRKLLVAAMGRLMEMGFRVTLDPPGLL